MQTPPKKVLKDGPGTLVGMSTYKPMRGSVVFYDGNTAFGEVELKEAWPPVVTKDNERLPGVIVDRFCEESIIVEHPEGINDGDIEFIFS